MKILFDNILEDATLSATNESLNYPVANLGHPFLEKRQILLEQERVFLKKEMM